MPVGNADSDVLAQLAESGKITDDTPIAEVERLVAEAEAGGATTVATSAVAETAEAADTVDHLAAPSIAALVTQASAAPVDKQQGTPTAAPVAVAEEEPAPIATPSGRTIDYGVLKSTRQQRDQYRAQAEEAAKALEDLREENRKQTEQLQRLQATGQTTTAQVQQAVDAAGVTDQRGRPVDVATVDIESLRNKFPDEIVDIIAAQQKTIEGLAQRDAVRVQTEHLTREQQLQADIDSVPALAKWQADQDPSMWNAAVAVRQTLGRDEAWKGKPQVEVFEEVARRLGGQVSPPVTSQQQNQTGTTPGAKAASALQAAQLRAVPHTHSDLPAGTPVAQSELEGLSGLDVTQIAEKMAGMTPAQEEEFMRRYG